MDDADMDVFKKAPHAWKQAGVEVHYGRDCFKWRRRTWRERLFSWPWRPWENEEPYAFTDDFVKVVETSHKRVAAARQQNPFTGQPDSQASADDASP
jgi:hypothetical protein